MQAKLWQLSNPTQSIIVTQGINAFCNDTSLVNVVNPDQPWTTTKLIQTTQTNLNLWNNLLEASGGMLNPTKCTRAHFQWQTHHDLLMLQAQTQDNPNPQLILSCLGNTPQPLQKLQPYMPYWYLGVHLTMTSDWKKELLVLNNYNTKYLQVLTICSLNRCKAKVIYWQCYLPAVTYPLPESVIPPDKLHKAQCSTTTAFLIKMGYPCTFLQAVMYAPKPKEDLDSPPQHGTRSTKSSPGIETHLSQHHHQHNLHHSYQPLPTQWRNSRPNLREPHTNPME